MNNSEDPLQWVRADGQNPFPRISNEFVMRNDHQGGVLTLVSWNSIHSHFQTKGEVILPSRMGTHFLILPKI